ncbi:hypothetical protein C8Q72DRAFT_503355 [Fomitopsis betulina]|nr:hypothetical protein C8Q72DRAFT_503355 [Fomitopsis betulina]
MTPQWTLHQVRGDTWLFWSRSSSSAARCPCRSRRSVCSLELKRSVQTITKRKNCFCAFILSTFFLVISFFNQTKSRGVTNPSQSATSSIGPVPRADFVFIEASANSPSGVPFGAATSHSNLTPHPNFSLAGDQRPMDTQTSDYFQSRPTVRPESNLEASWPNPTPFGHLSDKTMASLTTPSARHGTCPPIDRQYRSVRRPSNHDEHQSCPGSLRGYGI